MIDWTAVGEEAARLLGEYIGIRSVNPPGNEKDAADFIADFLRTMDLEPQVFSSAPGRANVTARLPGNGSKRPILLYNHLDVVEADPSLWSCDPFGGEIREGYVWGRGAIDMKGMGIMELMALNLLRRYVPERTRDIIFFAAADEEGGGVYGTQWMLEHHGPEIDAEYVWDEGGFGLADFFGSCPVFTVAVAEKKTLWVRLVARGEAGHSGMPRPDNAAERLIRALQRLSESKEEWELHPVTEKMFKAVGRGMKFPRSFLLKNAGNPLVFRALCSAVAGNMTISAMLRDTMSVTALRAGGKENVIPDKAEATLDIRLLPNRDPEEYLGRLKKIIDDDTIECDVVLLPEESSVSDMNSHFYNTLSAVITELVPEGIVAPMMTPGTTDSCFFRQKGISSYGLFPAIIGPDELARFHGVDERISVENLRLGIRVFYEVLRRLCTE